MPDETSVAALAEALHDVFGDDGGAHASTEATTCRYCEDYAARLLASPVLADLLRAERVRALREAADAWTQGAWSDVMLPKPTPPAVPVIAYANGMGDWLRDHAEREAGG